MKYCTFTLETGHYGVLYNTVAKEKNMGISVIFQQPVPYYKANICSPADLLLQRRIIGHDTVML